MHDHLRRYLRKREARDQEAVRFRQEQGKIAMQDQQTFRNEDLVLHVSPSYNPQTLDLSKYEPFLDALCGTREYQAVAIRETIRYFLCLLYTSPSPRD